MKGRIIAAILVLTLLCGGCCYAPGYEGGLSMEKFYDVKPVIFENGYENGANVRIPEATQAGYTPAHSVEIHELPDGHDADIVRVRDHLPELLVDLVYATDQNFTGGTLYQSGELYLRYGTVRKLNRVQQELQADGFQLKILDGYRSAEAQSAMWTAHPDNTYVVNPELGYSPHIRCNTVDVTLVHTDGSEAEMPGPYYDFTPLSDRVFTDCSEEASANAKLLQKYMKAHGMVPDETRWWQFTDETNFREEPDFDPTAVAVWYPECKEYISLRTEPNVHADVIAPIKVGESFTVLGWHDEFAYVQFQGQQGYVLKAYIKPNR